jgi:hypothetical protein
MRRVCVSADAPITMCRDAGSGSGRIFWPRGRKRTRINRLRRPARDALKKKDMFFFQIRSFITELQSCCIDMFWWG